MTLVRAARTPAAVATSVLMLAGCQGSLGAAAVTTNATTPAERVAAPVTTAARAMTSRSTPAAGVKAARVALAELGHLVVARHVSLAGYSRLLFGPAWPTIHGCDARNRVLARDMTHVVYRRGGCLVASGTLVSPYTGQVIHFLRGPATSDAVEVDHVVPLAQAMMTGAKSWTPAKREAFANDPAELLAVDRASNQAKGDLDAASWLPPRRAEDCPYLEVQLTIKSRYRLTVTRAEHDAMARALTRCAATVGAA